MALAESVTVSANGLAVFTIAATDGIKWYDARAGGGSVVLKVSFGLGWWLMRVFSREPLIPEPLNKVFMWQCVNLKGGVRYGVG